MTYHVTDPRFTYHNARSHKDDPGAFRRRQEERLAVAQQARLQAASIFKLIPRKQA